jgi:hypothetical protein
MATCPVEAWNQMASETPSPFTSAVALMLHEESTPGSTAAASDAIGGPLPHRSLSDRISKCFSRRCRKGHCSNFTDDTHKDFFRKFPSPWESWREHSRMISSGRYAKLKKNGRDFRKWAIGLKQLGYATDSKYDIKLIEMIEKHELWKYDR